MNNVDKDNLLKGPLLKIQRAKKHIDDLEGEFETYLRRKPFSLIFNVDRKLMEKTISVQAKQPIPDTFSLIAGDAIHNLHSALDLLAFGMVGDRAKSPKQVSFPFAESADGLDKVINDRQLKLAGNMVVDAIRLLRPYTGGDVQLNDVHRLDILDKHRFILQIANVTIFDTTSLNELIGRNAFDGSGEIVFTRKIGDPIIKLPLSGNRQQRRLMRKSEQKLDVIPTYSLRFSDDNSEMAIPKLRLMEKSVEAAVTSICSAFCNTI